jgi:5-methylcytosine-specific restriction protein A
MPRALRVCPTPGCPELTSGGRCDTCKGAAEQRRGSARQRGYGTAHERSFRPAVLRRDPLCVCTDDSHDHGPQCLAPATVADHHPLSRRQLVDAGLNPNDPEHGRGLCAPCHNRSTADLQPGGWNR